MLISADVARQAVKSEISIKTRISWKMEHSNGHSVTIMSWLQDMLKILLPRKWTTLSDTKTS
jgi:hypothetical protein